MKFSIVESKDKKQVSLGSIQLMEPFVNSLSLFHPNSELFKQVNWKSYLDEIVNILFVHYDDDTLYYINCETEVLWIPFFKKIGLLVFLKKKFKNKKLLFRDGNTHPNKPDVGFEWDSECVFFGGSVDVIDKFNGERREFMKHFTCLQSRWSRSRENIYHHLYENDILRKTFYTFAPHDREFSIHYALDDGSNFHLERDESKQDTIDGKPIMFFPNQWYRQAFCSIVTESTFYPTDLPDTTFNKIFITEKTDKCFTAAQPFILVSNANSLKYLKSMGYKTFSRWWDESYDSEINDELRLQKIKNIISEISSWSLRKCETIWHEMHSVLKHNQDNSIKIRYNPDYSKKLFYSSAITLHTIEKLDNGNYEIKREYRDDTYEQRITDKSGNKLKEVDVEINEEGDIIPNSLI